jgi:phosphate:Na+ symporter
MVELVDNAYEVMIVNLNAAHDGVLLEISNALNAEIQINNLRNELRDAEIEELDESKKSYLSSVYYMDIVNELEKMGDFIINISQDLEKVYKK